MRLLLSSRRWSEWEPGRLLPDLIKAEHWETWRSLPAKVTKGGNGIRSRRRGFRRISMGTYECDSDDYGTDVVGIDSFSSNLCCIFDALCISLSGLIGIALPGQSGHFIQRFQR